MKRSELDTYLNDILKPNLFSDYGPNGLQVEGSETISKIAFAVSATKHSIEEAIHKGADTLIVHHGLFWKFHGVRTITGSFAKRIKPLIENQINLFGYHLPLDAQIEFGNAASIAKTLELENIEAFGDYKGSPTGVMGNFNTSIHVEDLRKKLQETLKHDILVSKPALKDKITSIGIITGGANGGWIEASKKGLDAYLTGEMSEHDWNEAQEEGIVMFAGGHHATERLGIQALMNKLQVELNLETFFIDSPNPA